MLQSPGAGVTPGHRNDHIQTSLNKRRRKPGAAGAPGMQWWSEKQKSGENDGASQRLNGANRAKRKVGNLLMDIGMLLKAIGDHSQRIKIPANRCCSARRRQHVTNARPGKVGFLPFLTFNGAPGETLLFNKFIFRNTSYILRFTAQTLMQHLPRQNQTSPVPEHHLITRTTDRLYGKC